MKKLLLLLVLVLPVCAQPPQLTWYSPVQFDAGPTTPPQCQVPGFFWNTTPTASLWLCLATNGSSNVGTFHQVTTGASGSVTSVTVTCGLTATPSNPIISTGSIEDSLLTAAHNGNYNPLLTTDCGKILTTDTTATFTFPTAGSTGFPLGWGVVVQNNSASSTLTLTTSGSVFNGNVSGTGTGTVTLPAGQGAQVISDTAGNWTLLTTGCNLLAGDVSGTCAATSVTSTIPRTIFHGTATMGTGAISANTCASAVTVTTTGVLTTDSISVNANADISAVTGYGVLSTDGLKVYVYPTSGDVNFKVCNATGTSITPGSAIVFNFSVYR